ncbi:non-specific lipid transfer protein GPI-anchored 9-like [Arachis stenosperma]|uniref:non-specific lipid transfer protein GPI-anchored 9-like n=1 Tax=Arachis stenosperma TaxID=217475 RepID=UPI0025AC97C8|nr:non-specific lipid transfer protein GPI-anchored 9-like [Arachis stenosperma]
MASKVMFSFFLIFSSIVHQGISQSLEELLGGLGKNMGVVKEAQCMQKLVACNKYLKDQSNVPEECCGPLREIATSNDQECLCAFFNNQQMLDSMQISRDDAMKLPNACSVPVEISTCNNVQSPPVSDINLDPKMFGPPAESSSATGLIRFGVSSFFALLAAALF